MTSYKMNLKFSGLFLAACIMACGTSCVYINEELGSNFIPTDQRYDIHIDTLALTGIGMKPVDDLSGYSSSRITVGAIMNSGGKVSSRSSAFTLIPASKYDFGKGGTVSQFHFAIAKDTLSYIDEGQKSIIQNINVFSLKEKIKEDQGYLGTQLELGERITDGIPVYHGGDSLSFDFSNAWANGFLKKLQDMETSAYDSVGAFTEKVFPGIHLSVDNPVSEGGRINIFTLTIGADLSEYTLSGGYALLKVKDAEFDGKTVADTSFLFMYGASDFSITQAASDYYSGETLTSQYALNMSSQDSDDNESDIASEAVMIEGGGGLKPVVYAKDLSRQLKAKFEEKGIDPASVIINKATIVLPFDNPGDRIMNTFPALISPTCKVINEDNEKLVNYAGITDASSSSENQGDINRSIDLYSPDISYHMQQILGINESDYTAEELEKEYSKKDIWFLTMSKEVQEEEQEGTSEYMQNLAYSSYYNNLYNYGYGSYYGGYYGGYGGYGYNNYYDYSTLAMYYAMQNQSSSSQTESTTELDRDRYYSAILRGPQADGYDDAGKTIMERRIPAIIVTYSVRKR